MLALPDTYSDKFNAGDLLHGNVSPQSAESSIILLMHDIVRRLVTWCVSDVYVEELYLVSTLSTKQHKFLRVSIAVYYLAGFSF